MIVEFIRVLILELSSSVFNSRVCEPLNVSSRWLRVGLGAVYDYQVTNSEGRVFQKLVFLSW